MNEGIHRDGTVTHGGIPNGEVTKRTECIRGGSVGPDIRNLSLGLTTISTDESWEVTTG